MVLDDCSKGRDNNLNLIRFIAAILVIFSHSFPLTANGMDYIGRITDGQIDCGGIAVSIFFFYGGFLICRSVNRIKTAKEYFKVRLKRIIPPLAFVTFVLAFIVGPVFTDYSVKDYLLNVNTYKYLLNSILVLVHDLPGVFVSNAYGATVNGPLWTLPIEFLCYIMCYVLYAMRFLETKKLRWIVFPAFLLYIAADYVLGESLLKAALRPAMLFFVGMLCYVYRSYIKIRTGYAVLAFCGCIIGAWLGIFNIVIFICFTYFLLWLAFGTGIKCDKFGTKYEISYGMYLTGWPIQQCICDITANGVSWWGNFLIAALLSVVCGLIITVLERKFIR